MRELHRGRRAVLQHQLRGAVPARGTRGPAAAARLGSARRAGGRRALCCNRTPRGTARRSAAAPRAGSGPCRPACSGRCMSLRLTARGPTTPWVSQRGRAPLAAASAAGASASRAPFAAAAARAAAAALAGGWRRAWGFTLQCAPRRVAKPLFCSACARGVREPRSGAARVRARAQRTRAAAAPDHGVQDRFRQLV